MNNFWLNILVVTNSISLVFLLMLCYKLRKKIINWIIDAPHSRGKFLKIINQRGTLLDVGCGNNSPYNIKTKLPDIVYTGIDVGDYNQTKPMLADNYIITSPETFADKIMEFKNEFDTVICSHNLEHCNDRNKTLESITNALKSGGYLYLSFPSENSVHFPGPRSGCLNYYDDSSHKDVPPQFDEVIAKLKNNSMKILFAAKSYKPIGEYIIGFLNERQSRKEKVIKRGTWAYWGFETIIWARKR